MNDTGQSHDPEHAEVLALLHQMRDIASSQGFSDLTLAMRTTQDRGDPVLAGLMEREVEKLPSGFQIEDSDFADAREFALCISTRLSNGVVVAINF